MKLGKIIANKANWIHIINRELKYKGWLLTSHYSSFSMWKPGTSIKNMPVISLSIKKDGLAIDTAGGYEKDEASEALSVLNILLDRDIDVNIIG